MKKIDCNQNVRTISAIFCLCAALAAGCGRIPYDPGRELVNASGTSVQATLAVLRKGCDVNARSKSHFGWTPLISAIYSHKEDVVDLLLAAGANPNVTDDEKRTPLIWAIQQWGQNTNLILKLVRQGADPRIRTGLGTDAFDTASSQPNAAALVTILRMGEERKGIIR